MNRTAGITEMQFIHQAGMACFDNYSHREERANAKHLIPKKKSEGFYGISSVILIILIGLISSAAFSTGNKSCMAVRTEKIPKINGSLDEAEWLNASPADGFIQFRPDEGKPGTQQTEVRLLYTDFALYIGAWCYDLEPSSIRRQLGKRDEGNLNADYFVLKIDPYNKQQDAYTFGVYASGVQLDSRISDFTYDAVWKSAVSRDSKGWYAELEIPFSAFRFPKTEQQTWVVQFQRYIRRNRELQTWSYVPSEASNPLQHWGLLLGVEAVKTPLRLNLVPYVAYSAAREPLVSQDGSRSYSSTSTYAYGADVKYGINDRFTLDMTLLPDFGQVQSDRLVKNLSYREVVYDENRPFFREGVELFGKGDLFYSRRVGRIPNGFFSVFDKLLPGEELISNPIQTKLLNAAKISGRTGKGLGLGFFNAVTDAMYAEVRGADGSSRLIETEPLTDYSIFVADKQWKNNSSLYLINTLALRNGQATDVQASGGGLTLSNRKNTIRMTGEGSAVIRHGPAVSNRQNYRYSLGLQKVGGWLQGGLFRNVTAPRYDATDMGFYRVPGQNTTEAGLTANQFRPWKFIRESNTGVNLYLADDFNTGKIGYNELSFNSFINLMSWNALFTGAGVNLIRPFDFFEARVPGQVYRGFRSWYVYAGISTDYRKAVAVDYSFSYSDYTDRPSAPVPGHELSFRIRPSDRIFFTTGCQYKKEPYNIGFATLDSAGKTVIGGRRLDTWEVDFRGTYSFNENMNLTVIARHYWLTGRYKDYYGLDMNGELTARPGYAGNSDFNFNIFTVDCIYEWRFSPGSVLNLVYKNAVTDEMPLPSYNYANNFDRIMHMPHASTVTAKLLVFIDYIRLFGKKKV